MPEECMYFYCTEKVGFLRCTRTPILSEEGNCATTGGKTQLLLTARAS